MNTELANAATADGMHHLRGTFFMDTSLTMTSLTAQQSYAYSCQKLSMSMGLVKV